MNLNLKRKNNLHSMILIGILLSLIVLALILFIIAWELIDSPASDYWNYFIRALKFDFSGGSSLIYIVMFILLVIWFINIAIFWINRKTVVDDNILMLSFLFSVFFLYFVSFFAYIFTEMNFIRHYFEDKKAIETETVKIPEHACFDYEKLNRQWNLEHKNKVTQKIVIKKTQVVDKKATAKTK